MQEHLVKIIQFEQHLPLRPRFCGGYEQFLGLCVLRGGKALILGHVQALNLPYFARKRPKFRRSPKDGQLYHPGGDRRNA